MNQGNHSAFTMGSTIVLVVGSIFLVVGYCILTFWGKPTLENAKASTNWPTVQGEVTESRVGIHSDEDGTTYSADITYRYTVNETEIHSDNVWFGGDYSSSARSQFEKIVSRYPVGKEVKVFYKPDDIFIAVLEPGTHFSSYIGFAMGWGFLLIGAALLLVPMAGLFRGRKSHDAEMTTKFEIEQH